MMPFFVMNFSIDFYHLFVIKKLFTLTLIDESFDCEQIYD